MVVLIGLATRIAFRGNGGGRRVPASDQMAAARSSLYAAALPSALPSGFALLGDSLFSVAKKVSKNACPYIRVSLRETSLIPSALRGPAYKGHPWPFTPLAASMPLAPLRADSIRPTERGVRRRLVDHLSGNKQSVLVSLCPNFQTTRIQFPFRRPSEDAAQGDARHGCRARSDGTWMSLRDDPRSSTGAREVLRSKTRMQGWPSFWLLFLGHSRKSDSPSRAKPMPQPTPATVCIPRSQSQSTSVQRTRLHQPNFAPQARRQALNRHQKRPLVCA